MVGTGPPSSSSSSMFTAWIAAMSRIDFTNSAAAAAAAVNSTSSSDSMPEVRVSEGRDSSKDSDNQAVGYSSAQLNLGFRERAFSAAGAAFLSAIIVNPLDVVEFRCSVKLGCMLYISGGFYAVVNVMYLLFCRRECKPRQLVPPIIHTPMRTSERPWRLSEKTRYGHFWNIL